MKCKNCGSELKPNATFCGNCGTRIEAPAAETSSPKPPVQETVSKVKEAMNNQVNQNIQKPQSIQPQQPRPQQPYSQPQQPYSQPQQVRPQQPYPQPQQVRPQQPYPQPQQVRPQQPYPQPQQWQPPMGGMMPPQMNPINRETSVATIITFLIFAALGIFAVVQMFFFGVVETEYWSETVPYNIFDLLDMEEVMIMFILFNALVALAFLILMIIGLVKVCTKRNSAVWKLIGGSSIALFLGEATTVLNGVIWITEYSEPQLSILPIVMTVVFFITMILGFALSGKFRQRKAT